MTFHSGMRRRKVPVLPSTPQAPTRASDGVAPLDRGGTNASTPAEAREQLGVPGLADDNTFTGTNVFQNGISVTGGSVDATAANADFADISGAYATINTVETEGLRVGYDAKTADYTIDPALDCLVNVTANSPTITLPSAPLAGSMFIIKNSGAGTVTLATTSSQTIDGAAPGTVAAGGVIRLVSTGSNWVSV